VRSAAAGPISLAGGLPKDQVVAHKAALAGLATRLHEWAQLLKLANAFLRDRVHKHHELLDRAIAGLNRRFDARGVDALGSTNMASRDDRHRSVAAVLNTSLELLATDKRVRFGELRADST
jgi:hypothetical protein